MKNEKQRLKHNAHNLAWSKRNRKKCAAYLRNWQRKRSTFVMGLKRDKRCIFCGESHIACLDFHHRDKTKKLCMIQRLARSTSSNNIRVLEEIEKCDLICSNCHRKIHYEEGLQK